MRYSLASRLSRGSAALPSEPTAAAGLPGRFAISGKRWAAALLLLLSYVGPALALGDGTGDSGPISAGATPANSSHAAGTSVGGLFKVPTVRLSASATGTSGSGIITNFYWKSTGGSTGSLVIRIWSKMPSATCTDNIAFAGNDGDDGFLITPPFSITPAAPGSTTGDPATYANIQGVTWDYANNDGNSTTGALAQPYLYVCAVTVATDTADQNKGVRVTLSGPQN